MLVCFWLISSLNHMISGCSLSAPQRSLGTQEAPWSCLATALRDSQH
uniref:Uncharacterized protein n=1 Tax=Anguilla anguilla TaxID=7936 RepID=A0A0E9PYS5_ANGAN